jgi:GrpB-like predicted nucleotidyltransferase (UPF0157 family)
LRKTKIDSWTDEWEKSYSREKEKLKEVFKEELVDIYHIGSTSIPTIGFAKPIIDILIVVRNIKNVDLYNSEMLKLEYEPKGENGIAGRRYFTKGKDNRTHHVHIFQFGSEFIKIHLDFKEFLIKNPIEAKKYGELKINLAKQFPDEHHKYQEGKQQFVNNLVKKVKEWATLRGFPY